jgi:peptide-methionine (S)-S-oxide reductase
MICTNSALDMASLTMLSSPYRLSRLKEGSMIKTILAFLIYSFLFLSVPATSAEKAVFAGGCFWCMEADFQDMDGVLDAISGFIGGSAPNPTYNGNHDGHYEAVEVTFDSAIVSYQELLNRYWVNIDPFDARGQFCDKGPSYLAAIFVVSEEQRELAEKSLASVKNEFSTMKVVTKILPATTFYPIKGSESDHQDYYINHSIRYKFYRTTCGRDRRLEQIWGDRVTH